jgi:phosphoglycerate dehydrogenase-like enzyme
VSLSGVSFKVLPFSFHHHHQQQQRHQSTMAASAMKGGDFAHNNTTAPRSTKVMPLFSLKGRTAIVSGAGAGIGLAVAQGFAEAGANVAIWYNSNKKAIERATDIEKEYGVKCKISLLPPHPALTID